jgi:hypothetical protein
MRVNCRREEREERREKREETIQERMIQWIIWLEYTKDIWFFIIQCCKQFRTVEARITAYD